MFPGRGFIWCIGFPIVCFLFVVTDYGYHGNIFFRFFVELLSGSLWVVSIVLCLKGTQVRSAQSASRSGQRFAMSSTRSYGSWKTGAHASWQSGGPWKIQKTNYSAELISNSLQNSRWSDAASASYWQVDHFNEQSCVSSACSSRDEWRVCNPPTVKLLLDPQAEKAEKAGVESVAVHALANFS